MTRRIDMTVTFLEMTARPAAAAPPQPRGQVAILRAHAPASHFYRYLYDTIGGPYYWVERRRLDDAALNTLLHDPAVAIYVLYAQGCPVGLGEIDFRKPGQAHIAYFGLIPEAIGRGLGAFFLHHLVSNAWADETPVKRVIVNTCTLDHPRALPLYQRAGFNVYAREPRYVEVKE